jgi:hypothetical protein
MGAPRCVVLVTGTATADFFCPVCVGDQRPSKGESRATRRMTTVDQSSS